MFGQISRGWDDECAKGPHRGRPQLGAAWSNQRAFFHCLPRSRTRALGVLSPLFLSFFFGS